MNCSKEVLRYAKRQCQLLRRTLGLVVLLCLIPIGTYAQNTIKGTVSDSQGPIIGATVKVKEANTGAITDYDGNYTIQANSSQTLVFSYVGYKTFRKTTSCLMKWSW